MEQGVAVKDFFSGKNVFITGGSGFVGLALTEKLLRSIPDIGAIYLLLREKRGKPVERRLAEIIDNGIMRRVKEERGEAWVSSRLVAVTGDIGVDGLGLSPEDKDLLTRSVSVIFHSAASLDFAENLRQTVEMNLLGTRRVLALARDCTQLQALVHVSSTYANSNLREVKEKIYPVHMSSDKAVGLVESLGDSELQDVTPRLLGDHPNPYTLTKALAEQEVAGSGLPAAIVRPSMIVASWKQPEPGWTSSKNGPQGFIMGASKGIVRRLPLDPSLIADYIPVDLVVNGLVAAAASAASRWKGGEKETEVLQLSSSSQHPFRWSSVNHKVMPTLHMFPLRSAVWVPHLKFLPSLLLFRLSALFYHFLPALFFDGLVFATGGRPILLRMHTNVLKSLSLLKPFIFTEWKFDNSRTQKLHSRLSKAEQEEFGMDVSQVDWTSYFETLTLGVRRHLHREKDSSLPAARRKLELFIILNWVLQVALAAFIWTLSAHLSGCFISPLALLPPLLFILFLIFL